MAYSIEFRKQVIDYLRAGHTYIDTYEKFSISNSALVSWQKRLRETGSLQPGYRKSYVNKIDPKKLEQYIKENPATSRKIIAKHFNCSQSALINRLKQLGCQAESRPVVSEAKLRADKV